LKIASHKRAGGMAQGVGHVFKPQYHKKKKKDSLKSHFWRKWQIEEAEESVDCHWYQKEETKHWVHIEGKRYIPAPFHGKSSISHPSPCFSSPSLANNTEPQTGYMRRKECCVGSWFWPRAEG
jgi:hypothetical protein